MKTKKARNAPSTFVVEHHPPGSSRRRAKPWLALLLGLVLVLVTFVSLANLLKLSNAARTRARLPADAWFSDAQQFIPERQADEVATWNLTTPYHYYLDQEDPRPLENVTRFKNFGFLSVSSHISPIIDVEDLLVPLLGIRVVNLNYHNDHCKRWNCCGYDQVGWLPFEYWKLPALGECPGITKRIFFYPHLDWIQSNIDVFICTHNVAMCEAYMAFNKSMILLATTRFDLKRMESPVCMQQYIENIRKIAADPRNVIAANNLYDVHYIRYFAGINNIELLPSYCSYTGITYKPRDQRSLLVGLNRGVTFKPELFQPLKDLWAAGKTQRTFELSILAEMGQFEYDTIGTYTAILLIPYQVSIMSMFEYYRMNIPLFAPSLKLLTEWHMSWRCVKERSWHGAWWVPVDRSWHPHHPETPPDLAENDPNDDFDAKKVELWLSFADFYHWPHVTLFDSWEDLADKLDRADFKLISRKMKRYNRDLRSKLERRWYRILKRMLRDVHTPGERRLAVSDYDEAMRILHGVQKPDDVCDRCLGVTEHDQWGIGLAREAWGRMQPEWEVPVDKRPPPHSLPFHTDVVHFPKVPRGFEFQDDEP